MSGRLEGKTALITAAGQGIGHATAIAMAREGAHVFATDVKPHLLEQFSGVANVSTRALDVLDDAAIGQARRRSCRRSTSCSTARATFTTGRFSTASRRTGSSAST